MSALAILTAAQSVVQSALPSDTLVLAFAPRTISVEHLVYLAHHDYTDVVKANSVIFRIHHITIRLMVRASAGDETAVNAVFLPLSDSIASAFYPNHRLNGTSSNAELKPGTTGGGADYIEYKGTEYRQREWLLDATEILSVTFA
ncbi:MAG TPA: hypothetical protein VIG44_01220 [Thermomicrobiales bacterium]|jgi:hypothetical protein